MNITPRLPQYPRKLPSLDEKVVWRIPGESWACSRPEFHFDWIHPPSGCVTHICDVCVEQVVFLTVYHRGPLPLRELHPTDETWVWRDPGGSWACLRPVSHYRWIRLARSCNTDMYVSSYEAGRFSYGESPRTPPLEGTSPHRRHTSVERPWGILSLFMTCFR